MPERYFAPFWEDASAEIYEQLISDLIKRENLTLWGWRHRYTHPLGSADGKRPPLDALVRAWHTLLSEALTARCVWPVRVELPADGGEPYLLVEKGTRATKRGVDRRLANAGVPGSVPRACWYGAYSPLWDLRGRRRLIRAWRRSTGLSLPPGLGDIFGAQSWTHMRLGGRVMFRYLEQQILRYRSLGPSPVTEEDLASWLASTDDASVREFGYEALGRWKPRDDA